MWPIKEKENRQLLILRPNIIPYSKLYKSVITDLLLISTPLTFSILTPFIHPQLFFAHWPRKKNLRKLRRKRKLFGREKSLKYRGSIGEEFFNKFGEFKMTHQATGSHYFHAWCPLQRVFCFPSLDSSLAECFIGRTDGRTPCVKIMTTFSAVAWWAKKGFHSIFCELKPASRISQMLIYNESMYFMY